MAKKKQPPDEQGNPQGQNGESVAGYFRKVFQENPGLLKGKSNKDLLDRWLADHPGHSEVPRNVKASLSNIKSVLRSKKRKRVAGRKQELEGAEAKPVAKARNGTSDLESLERQIDECLIVAKTMDRKGLDNVIEHLRMARNGVVWKLGQ